MNVAATSTNTSPLTHLLNSSDSQYQGSLLDRIISRLSKVLKAFVIEGHTVQRHKSFVDANLLDPLMGPEISRTLRQ